MPISTRSTFAKLREGLQERFELGLRERVQASLEATPLESAGSVEVLLFGSRARGDWDGRPVTDLLVVADTHGKPVRCWCASHERSRPGLAAASEDQVAAMRFRPLQRQAR